MTTLARKLRVVDYFTLGWGTMVGVGWLVVMDDWLLRGGALGGVLGLPSVAPFLLPIGYVYGKLVRPCPTPPARSPTPPMFFPTGQLCHWLDDDAGILHRLSVGSGGRRQNCGLYFPGAGFDGAVSNCRPAGVFAASVIGLGSYRLLTLLNYRGIRLSAIFRTGPLLARLPCSWFSWALA